MPAILPADTSSLLRTTSAIIVYALLSGCGLLPLDTPTTDSNAVKVDPKKLAEFYMPYAAMAARVYDTKGRSDDLLSKVASSSWLRYEMTSGTPDQHKKLNNPSERQKLYRERVGRHCKGDRINPTLAADDSAVRAAEDNCRQPPENSGQEDSGNENPVETGQLSIIGKVPTKKEDCHFEGGDSRPMLPLKEMTVDWEVVPELQRSVHPRGWSVFVPGLAIDVWRKRLSPNGEAPEVEYALVFRGTAGGGGWVSNFRVLSAFTPLVWDQYNQARVATTDLINQIYQLHALSDALFERKADTRIRITAVGHSLGGGLASYVFLRVPQITRVVSFDPSPINGASYFSPEMVDRADRPTVHSDRASVMSNRKQPRHTAPFDEQSDIFVLYEHGDAVTRLAGCAPGAIWGSEGGPVVRCDEMNLSRGNPFRQHNMPQLACKLYLFSKDIPTR